MLSIDADNRAAERCIGKIAELAQARGASFSPQMTLRCRNRELSVTGPQTGESGYLMNLPRSCLIPLRQFPFAGTGEEITVSATPDADPEQKKLAEAIVELYNLTGKLAAHKSSSSWSFIAAHPALAPLIVESRNGPSVRALAERVVKGDTSSLVLDTFIKSRVITVGNSAQTDVVLMPVGDFMNHAFQAPAFEFPGSGVAIRRFRAANDECVVCYGPYDAFDTWLTYSFADTQAPVIRSIPLEISLPGVGSIVVNGHIQHSRHGKLPQPLEDLRLYIPNILEQAQNRIVVDYLLIPGNIAPRALRRVLGLLISQMQPGARLEDLVAAAEVQVIQKNISYYKNLQSVLKNLVLKDAAWKPVADDLARLCALHLSRLGEYAANRGF